MAEPTQQQYFQSVAALHQRLDGMERHVGEFRAAVQEMSVAVGEPLV